MDNDEEKRLIEEIKMINNELDNITDMILEYDERVKRLEAIVDRPRKVIGKNKEVKQ